MFLSDSLLDSIHQRADHYDRSNEFPELDYQALKEAGYYKAFVPKEFGGHGLTLEEIAQEQTRLAKAAPGTALGINMHQIIVGLGRHLVAHGQAVGQQILKDAAQGHLLAFGISEPSNDRVLFGSICQAQPQSDGGYLFYGDKVFLSMIKACSRFVTFATDSSQEQAQSVFAYAHKQDNQLEIHENWDTLGMRATQSHSVTLKGLQVRPEQILAKLAPGPSLEPTVFGIFAYFEILLAATYLGIGQRALELGLETVKKRYSVSNQTTYDQDKNIRWRLAEAAIQLDAIPPQLNHFCQALDQGQPYDLSWLPRLSALKNRSVEASKTAVEEVIRACGGQAYFSQNELSRLYRDVLAGLFQPSDQESLHEAWASMLLGPIKS